MRYNRVPSVGRVGIVEHVAVTIARAAAMTFDEILEQVIALLQRQKRVAYRALKRRFNLDDAYLEDLKAELRYTRHVAIDEDN
jgi:hypothetical protein